MTEKEYKSFCAQLGSRLRERRLRAGWTQEDMIGFGFSARHWQQLKAGRPITIKTLLRACLA